MDFHRDWAREDDGVGLLEAVNHQMNRLRFGMHVDLYLFCCVQQEWFGVSMSVTWKIVWSTNHCFRLGNRTNIECFFCGHLFNKITYIISTDFSWTSEMIRILEWQRIFETWLICNMWRWQNEWLRRLDITKKKEGMRHTNQQFQPYIHTTNQQWTNREM